MKMHEYYPFNTNNWTKDSQSITYCWRIYQRSLHYGNVLHPWKETWTYKQHSPIIWKLCLEINLILHVIQSFNHKQHKCLHLVHSETYWTLFRPSLGLCNVFSYMIQTSFNPFYDSNNIIHAYFPWLQVTSTVDLPLFLNKYLYLKLYCTSPTRELENKLLRKQESR